MSQGKLPTSAILEEAFKLLSKANEEHVDMRLLGGIAVRSRCPSSQKPPLARSYEDLDFVVRGPASRVTDFFLAQNWKPDKEFNLYFGANRLIFYSPQKLKADIFVSKFMMCHNIPLAQRMTLDDLTLPLSELLLTKLQIVEINNKDFSDATCILLDYEIGEQDGEMLNGQAVARLCANNWGLWRTVTSNLEKLRVWLDTIELASTDRDIVKRRIIALESRVMAQTKTPLFKWRALFGDRVRWYEIPEEPGSEGEIASPTFKKEDQQGSNFLHDIQTFLHEKKIENAVPMKLRRLGLNLEQIERIGGLTNSNYKLKLDGKPIVLRLPGRGVGSLINRAHEKVNNEIAIRAGFSLPILHFDSLTGVKITAFAENATTLSGERAREATMNKRVAELLGRFHTSGIVFVNDYKVFKMITRYESVVRNRFAKLYPDYSKYRKRIFALRDRYEAACPGRVACHNDTLPENFLDLGDELSLIDFEYSGMNDPAWDVAAFFLESEFTQEEEKLFLEHYGKYKKLEDNFLVRIKACKLLQDFLWSIWALIEETSAGDAERSQFYRSYGENRYERSLALLPTVEKEL